MPMPIVRIFTGEDGESHFECTEVALLSQDDSSAVSKLYDAHEVQFEETISGGSFDWHNAPRRQFVVTLCGRLQFETRLGETQEIAPGDVLLAEDTTGGGHRWKLGHDDPWRRIYGHLESG